MQHFRYGGKKPKVEVGDRSVYLVLTSETGDEHTWVLDLDEAAEVSGLLQLRAAQAFTQEAVSDHYQSLHEGY